MRLFVAIGAFLIPFGTAGPAGAHGVNGPPASNFATRLDGVVPATPTTEISLAPDRESVSLQVIGQARVVVLGYRGEPYLRIDAHGAWENRSSPAVALNRSRIPGNMRPVDHIASPRWVRISTHPSATWHDHRTHWMGGTTPPSVRNDPDHGHTITTWSIPLRIDDRAAAIDGAIEWRPPPAAWPWWALAAALVAAALFASRRSGGTRAGVTILATMAVAETLHIWGSWPFSNSSFAGRLGESLPSIGAVVACIGALVWVVRRGSWSAAPGLVLAGLYVFVSGGAADLASLTHVFVPSRLDPAVARLLVSIALGLGAGTAIVGLTRLRAARPET
ncbi:MAG: hypothetical protein ABJC79_16160 [Acidimicrobiia bacterium]